MALSGKHEFLMHDSKDKIFNFYLNEKEEISCISSNEKRQWTTKEDIMAKRCSSLDIDLDNKDQFHIVSYHYDGDLYYSYKKNTHWKNIQLTSLKKNEKSFYPRIKTIGNNVHIFYDLQQSNEGGRCPLIHYTYDEKQMAWITNNICTMRFNKFVNPYKVLTHKNKIVLLYTSIVNNVEEVFRVQYDSQNDKWGKPQQVSNSKDRKLYLDGFIDFEGNLHISWCQYEDQDGLTVKYLQSDLSNSDSKELNILTLSDRLNCSFPHLIYISKKLYCMWVQFNHLAVVSSNDGGKSWTKPIIVKESKNTSFKRYRYVGNSNEYKDNLRVDFLYGTEYPSIEFLGFGGDRHDEVPSSEF